MEHQYDIAQKGVRKEKVNRPPCLLLCGQQRGHDCFPGAAFGATKIEGVVAVTDEHLEESHVFGHTTRALHQFKKIDDLGIILLLVCVKETSQIWGRGRLSRLEHAPIGYKPKKEAKATSLGKHILETFVL